MATLTSTIKETVTLNGKERGSEISLEIASVSQVLHRIVTCPANVDTTIANFHSATNTSDNSLDVGDVKYVRVTNLDASNPVNLSLQVDAGEDDSAADESATILLAPGRSFVMGAADDSIAVRDDAATIETNLHDLESILIDPLTNAVAVEVFIAS